MADDEPLGAIALAEADLLDPQVVADGLVAARARERRLGVARAVAHPLAGDPVAAAAGQVAEVVVEEKPRSTTQYAPAQPPAAQVVLDLRYHRLVVGVAGPAPTP